MAVLVPQQIVSMAENMAEKGFKRDGSSSSPGSSFTGATQPVYDEGVAQRESLPRRVWDSFKRDPNAYATPKGVVGANGKVFDVATAAQATADSPLARKLKSRHLQMIAIGGSIGKGPVHIHLVNADTLRHRSFRRVWEGSCKRWPGKPGTRLRPYRCHVVLHSPCAGRDGRLVSRGGFILCLFHPFPGPCMGVRNGLELRSAMACCSAA